MLDRSSINSIRYTLISMVLLQCIFSSDKLRLRLMSEFLIELLNLYTEDEMAKALNIANYFIEIANRVDENDLTNLKLQKILYFAQRDHFRNTQSVLFEDKIEAWKYGPVVPDVYHRYKYCGNFPITLADIPQDMSEEIPEKDFLDGIWIKYGIYSANKLVQITHAPGTAWNAVYIPDQNTEIPLSMMLELE